ncbi:MAG TPA: transglutaminaseTgpA domain-containing protein, partial [Pseudomonadota bacterium]|nr:transglutaminaseTgpA domain-containing protein [Pseudomonadota bacterium]
MRFAATHKVVSYLMVTTAFLMLALTGELPPWLLLLTLAAMGGSYFFDPQQHPLMLRRSYNYSLYGAMLLLSALLLGNASGPEALWDGGLRMLCVLLVGKLWQRRHNGDYLQVYVVSFVMLLGATFVESSMLYALLLFLYVVFAMWTLTLFHLRREMEENYLLKHLPGRHGQAAESERVEVERILNSRRVVGPPFLLTTALAGLCTFFVALGLFLLLPRFHVTVELPFHRRALPSTGFSERLELGSHGLLRDNPRVVMRVELP